MNVDTFYRQVMDQHAQLPDAVRVTMCRDTWADLLRSIPDAPQPLRLPGGPARFCRHDPESVGIIHGLPVVIRNTVSPGGFVIE